jgi:hypothetical protein
MDFILQPWQLFLMILAGWINHEQRDAIEYLRTENQVLKEKLGKKRILLNDDQHRRLAVAGKVLGRKRLEEIGTLLTPDTILRRHRLLGPKMWDLLFVLEVVTRRVHFAGCTPNPHELWMKQVARNLTDPFDGFPPGKRYLIMEECRPRTVFFGQRRLENAVREYLLHHHQERGHQGLANHLISPAEDTGRAVGEIVCRERLGGLLRHYYHCAA